MSGWDLGVPPEPPTHSRGAVEGDPIVEVPQLACYQDIGSGQKRWSPGVDRKGPICPPSSALHSLLPGSHEVSGFSSTIPHSHVISS